LHAAIISLYWLSVLLIKCRFPGLQFGPEFLLSQPEFYELKRPL